MKNRIPAIHIFSVSYWLWCLVLILNEFVAVPTKINLSHTNTRSPEVFVVCLCTLATPRSCTLVDAMVDLWLTVNEKKGDENISKIFHTIVLTALPWFGLSVCDVLASRRNSVAMTTIGLWSRCCYGYRGGAAIKVLHRVSQTTGENLQEVHSNTAQYLNYTVVYSSSELFLLGSHCRASYSPHCHRLNGFRYVLQPQLRHVPVRSVHSVKPR